MFLQYILYNVNIIMVSLLDNQEVTDVAVICENTDSFERCTDWYPRKGI